MIKIVKLSMFVSLLCIFALISGCASKPAPAINKLGANANSLRMPEAAAPKVGQAIDVFAITAYMAREGSNLVHQGKVATNLTTKALPVSCRVSLFHTNSTALTGPQVYEKAQLSVGVLGRLVMKGNNIAMENTASGFFISESGAFVTSRHVLEKDGVSGFVVMTRDGRVFPVRDALASTTNDVVIMQVDGTGFTPLQIAPSAAIGSKIYVLSHPGMRYFLFTQGFVADYVVWPNVRRTDFSTWMNITADYAVGSSGAPVMDETGSVVGIVSSTESICAGNQHPQMVLKLCVPSAQLLDLIQPE